MWVWVSTPPLKKKSATVTPAKRNAQNQVMRGAQVAMELVAGKPFYEETR